MRGAGNWRFTLFINVPIGLLALFAAPALIKDSRNDNAPRLDIAGAVTVTGGLLSIIFGITSSERNGWGSPVTLGSLGLGALLLALFLQIESRSDAPLVDLKVLRRRTVSWGDVTGLVTFSMVTGAVAKFQPQENVRALFDPDQNEKVRTQPGSFPSALRFCQSGKDWLFSVPSGPT